MESRNPQIRGRILVVDADDWCRDFLSQVFKLLGIQEFRLASSIPEASEIIETEKFDLVITDLNHPEAQKLLEDIRQRFPGVRIILMLSRRAQSFSYSYFEQTDVVVKPLSLDEMVRKIREAILQRHRLQVEDQVRRFKQELSRFFS